MGKSAVVSLAALLLIIAMIAPKAAAADPGKLQYNRDIRPILAENCFACHGPDGNKRKAKLRLDTHEGMLADLEGKRPIVPGKPDASEVIKRITSTDEEEHMPPPKSGKKLRPEQIAILRRWIEEGADWQ